MTSLSFCNNIMFQRSALLIAVYTRPFACCLSAHVMLFSGFIVTYYILLLQKGCPTLVRDSSVGVDSLVCVYFWTIRECSSTTALHSAVVLESVPSVVSVALVTVSLKGHEEPGPA